MTHIPMNLGRENETVEFKKSTSEVRDAMNDIAAILNKHGGGILYFGVKPNGDVCGQEIGVLTLDDVARVCKDAIQPAIYPTIREEAIGGLPCVVVRFSGTERPYSSYGRYYMRVVDRSEPLYPDQLKAMLAAADQTSLWENNPTSYGIDEVDRDSLRLFYGKATSCGRLDPMPEYDETSLLSGLGLLDDGRLTNAGFYLFSSRKPVILKMATYLTDERIGFSDIRRIEGNIYGLIPVALSYIKEKMSWRVVSGSGASRIEIPEIPVDAIREIVVNAFAHADYRGTTEHEIDITPTRVEIYNPGGFPANMTPESFVREHRKSQPRNKIISNALYKSKDVEVFGSGFRKVFALCDSAGIKTHYDVNEDGFSFTFLRKVETTVADPTKNATEILTGPDLLVLNELRENPTQTRTQLAAKLRINSRTIQRILDKLVAAGKLSRIGSRKSGYWEIVVAE